MKKTFKFFLLFFTLFAMVGCSKNNVVKVDGSLSKNIISDSYLEKTIKEVGGFNFTSIIEIKDEKYTVNGSVILGDSISTSSLYLHYDNLDICIVKGEVYLNYLYKGTNVVVKDKLENFIDEVVSILNYKGVSVNSNTINQILDDLRLNSIDFNKLDEYVNKKNYIEFNNGKFMLNENKLVDRIDYQYKDIKIDVIFNYEDIYVKIPYSLFTLDIKDVKKLLKVDNLGELIKK